MNLNKRGRNGWTGWHALGSVLFVLAGIVVTYEAWADIFRIATKDEEFSHILLVPVVVAWLVWVRLRRFRYCRPQATLIGPALVAVGWLISTIGYSNAIQSFWHGGSVLVIVGCFITVAGRDVLVRFLPVFFVLIFLVPVPRMLRQQIAIPLQTATAIATKFAFEVIGIEVERAGNVLILNGVEVAIAEACNGMRMVFALALVSFAFAFGTPLRPYARVLVLVGSPLLAIGCNVLRLLPTVWIYGNYPTSIADPFHTISGWVMLPVAFLGLMGILRLLQWALVPVAQYTLAYD